MALDKLLDELRSDSSEQCYPARIEALKGLGRDTKNIEAGIASTLKVLDSGERSFVVYGEPQSGKTEFMIALTCKLIDMGYETIFVVMNDNTELEGQNFDRFHSSPELNPTPLKESQLHSMTDAELATKKQRIIFCRKNSKILQKLIQITSKMNKRVVIDDEADFATPNAKINKDDVTAINKYLGLLGDLDEAGEGLYIGVTATPARLDLNNTYANNSKNWVFLESHENYKGRSFFFPTLKEQGKNSDYKLVKLSDEGDDPKILRNAIFRFLLRTAMLNIHKSAERTPYSMLIHTAGRVNDHEKDQQDVQKTLGVLSNQTSAKFNKYAEELLKLSSKLINEYHLDYTDVQLVKFVINNIGKSEVLVINHKNDSGNVKRSCEPKALFTFAIGGNIVSRGLTFENLLTFFFSRNVKGKLQQNTYIQRARMFGNRPYSRYFELCVPESLLEDWADCFQDHELSLRLAKAGVYQHIQGKRTSVVDGGAIDKQNVTVENSERPIGEKFLLNTELENRLLKANEVNPIQFIKELKSSGLLEDEHFPSPLVAYLEEVSEEEPNSIYFVLRSVKGEAVLQNIERYSDPDVDTKNIFRPRGGIIHAMLNKRIEYETYSHFILPIKNAAGEARLMYKPKIGKKIIRNLKAHSLTV